MTKTKDTILKLYAQKRAELDALEEDVREIGQKVLKVLEDEGIDTLKEDWGTYSIMYRKKWTYSPALAQKELEYNTILKERKTEEQENGAAKVETAKSLTYRPYEEKA